MRCALRGPFDACFFAIGVASSGLDEDAYTRLTLAIASPMAKLNPDIIQPLHGAQSKTASYRFLYRLLAPLLPLLSLLPLLPLLPITRWFAARTVLSTKIIGRAMLNIARRGAAKPVLETADIRAAAQAL